MRYSYRQLSKLRSGQEVWRVMFYVQDGAVKGEVTRYAVLGKRVLHWFSDLDTGHPQWSSIRMECRRVEQSRQQGTYFDRRENTARFLNDLLGFGAFSQRDQAERFVREVESGLHPQVTEQAFEDDRWSREMADMLDRHLDDYPEDYPEDQVWNDSLGQGA